MSSPNVPKAMVIGDIYNRPWQNLAVRTLEDLGFETQTFDDPNTAHQGLANSISVLVVTSLLNEAVKRGRVHIPRLIAEAQDERTKIPTALILDDEDLRPHKLSKLPVTDRDIFIPKAPFDKIDPALAAWLGAMGYEERVTITLQPGASEVVVSPVVLHND